MEANTAMPRFFAEIHGSRAVIRGKDVSHIRGPLRMDIGERILVRDHTKGYVGIIRSIEHDRITVDIERETPLVDRTKRTIRLGICMIALKDMDTIVRFATELGVSEIVPVVSSRSNIVRISSKRFERWQAIIMEAVKQCERKSIPVLYDVLVMDDFIRSSSIRWPYKYFGHKEGELGLVDIKHDDVGIIIGPEGGFTADEIDMLHDNAFIPVNMGKTTLRSITSAITAVAFLGI